MWEVKISKKKVTKGKSNKPKLIDTNKLKSLEKELAEIEALIEKEEQNVMQAENEMAKTEVYSNPEKLASSNKLFEEAKSKLETHQASWEDIADKIDAIQDNE